MAGKPTCLVCQKEMEKGFISEIGLSGAPNLPRWCAGTPQKDSWTSESPSRKQADEGLTVVAYRCPECEALRLYAPSSGKK